MGYNEIMKKPIEIKETGSVFEVDSEGFIINPASSGKIDPQWQQVLDAVVLAYQEVFGDKLVSVYVRGSVAKGQAVEGVSDVDCFAYVQLLEDEFDRAEVREHEKKLSEEFSFVQKVEMEIDPTSYAADDQFWIGQAVLLYGKDLLTKKMRLDQEIIQHLKGITQISGKVQTKLSQDVRDGTVEDLCTWMCKQYLRAGIELCLSRSGKYSRDLYRCWEVFSEYYPEQSNNMKEVLYLALNPTSDKDKIAVLERFWAEWFLLEINKSKPYKFDAGTTV